MGGGRQFGPQGEHPLLCGALPHLLCLGCSPEQVAAIAACRMRLLVTLINLQRELSTLLDHRQPLHLRKGSPGRPRHAQSLRAPLQEPQGAKDKRAAPPPYS